MKYLLSTLLVLTGFNFFVWNSIISGSSSDGLNLYFLDVGQGDSSLIKLPGGAKVLIDGGPGKQTLSALYNAMPPTDKYIDVIILTHPQLDHFGGLIEILKRFKVGAVIQNGREGTASAWQDFKIALKESGATTIILEEGDRVVSGDSVIKFLSPNNRLANSKQLNDTVLVAELESEGSKTLFTADIGFKDMNAEGYITDRYDVDVDILKVAHHGSRYSSGMQFLRETTPAVSIVSAGRKNLYGHPTKEAIDRIKSVGSSLYRTDLDGTVHIHIKGGIVDVFKQKQAPA